MRDVVETRSGYPYKKEVELRGRGLNGKCERQHKLDAQREEEKSIS